MTKYKVPHTFIPGTKANATHINENFTSVVEAIEETKASGANLDLSNLSAAGKKAIFDNSSRSKLIGEIITSAIPLKDSGLHLLDGSKLLGGGIYDKFVQYIAGLVSANPSLFITEEKWQESVTNYGVCGKFVYDTENNSVRLPKITGFIEGTTDTAALGDLIEAGLPNITGQITKNMINSDGKSTGAFTQSSSSQALGGSNGYQWFWTTNFDASRSSLIYGKSATVQPQSIKLLYYIVVATTAKNDIDVNIDNIVTDLNGKVDKDLSNCTLPYVTETYQNDSSWYRVWSDGWVEQGGTISVNTGTATVHLIKNYKDTSYTVVKADNGTNTMNATGGKRVYNKTVNSFELFNSDINNGSVAINKVDWQTSGYSEI